MRCPSRRGWWSPLLPLLRLIACFLRREIIKDDDAAHVTLEKKIDAVDKKIDGVAQALGAKIDTVAQAVGAIARDVSFLAGRQMERDRAIGPQA